MEGEGEGEDWGVDDGKESGYAGGGEAKWADGSAPGTDGFARQPTAASLLSQPQTRQISRIGSLKPKASFNLTYDAADAPLVSAQLSVESRQTRHAELQGMRFNASDNTFIPGSVKR